MKFLNLLIGEINIKIAIIALFLIITLSFGCVTKCPPSAVEPENITFFFSVADNQGKDLFFGQDSIYDPHSVSFGKWTGIFNIINEKKCFAIDGIFPAKNSYIFYIEFISNDVEQTNNNL